MKLRDEYIYELNQYFKTLGSSIRFKRGVTESSIAIYIEDKFINGDSVYNLNDEFYQVLDGFFATDEIKLNYNNTRTSFWSFSNGEPEFKDHY